jgi:uncharacterized membrane protein
MPIAQYLTELGGLTLFLFAFVNQLKQWGLKGNALTVSAFVFGLIFGVGYRYYVRPLVTFADWFGAVVFGLLAGFTATRSYDGIQSAAKKTVVVEDCPEDRLDMAAGDR